jgi:4-hydroxy-tetrahydrodipicolinate reductase
MLRLALTGVTGRMGRAVLELAASAPDIQLVRGLIRPARDPHEVAAQLPAPLALTSRVAELVQGADVVVDFSHPAVTVAVAEAAAHAGIPLVSGTTGLSEHDQAVILRAAQHVPVVQAANFSLGIALLHWLLPELVARLPTWDVELIERHHRHKRDAPSGTALALARTLLAAREPAPSPLVYGRGPGTAPRQPGEVGIHAVRAGGEVGRHTVLLATDDEAIEVTHWVQSRRAYAQGALEAARRLVGRPPGLYTLQDLVT